MIFKKITFFARAFFTGGVDVRGIWGFYSGDEKVAQRFRQKAEKFLRVYQLGLLDVSLKLLEGGDYDIFWSMPFKQITEGQTRDEILDGYIRYRCHEETARQSWLKPPLKPCRSPEGSPYYGAPADGVEIAGQLFNILMSCEWWMRDLGSGPPPVTSRREGNQSHLGGIHSPTWLREVRRADARNRRHLAELSPGGIEETLREELKKAMSVFSLFARRRVIQRIIARLTNASLLPTVASSLLSRRQRPSQADVRSTTQRRGSTVKPGTVRSTTSRPTSRAGCQAATHETNPQPR